MPEFLKYLSNVIGVAFLSLIAIFYKTISLIEGLAILSLFLLIGFISIIIYYMSMIKRRIKIIEQ